MIKRISPKNLIISFVLVLSLILGTGCTILPDIETSPPQAAPPSPSPSPPPSANTTPADSGWSPPSSNGETLVLPSIADVVAKVKPSVVAITTQVVTFDFFNRPFTREGAGSGWIIDATGYVVTNNHVIEGAQSITVILDDGRTVAAEIVGADALSDLAVLKIDAENLLAVSVGDSEKLRIGDWVIAIGNALGQGISATQGVVSRKDASLSVDQGQTLYGLIQTDAAINPGNSGGPLVNMAGEVIGINSVKTAQVEVEGIGYAISTMQAMPIIEDLITLGRVVRPWLGVGLYTVDQFVVQRYNLAVEQGVLLTEVAPGSPADEAELEAGDVITKFGDKEIVDINEMIREIHSAQLGEAVEITFWRGEVENTTSAILAESPSS